jgi:hypothetical protein
VLTVRSTTPLAIRLQFDISVNVFEIRAVYSPSVCAFDCTFTMLFLAPIFVADIVNNVPENSVTETLKSRF